MVITIEDVFFLLSFTSDLLLLEEITILFPVELAIISQEIAVFQNTQTANKLRHFNKAASR